ncbi:MAG: sigma-54-dependent Fis family transcriptional regulator [Myxococcales bacterium]|nr:sigma-54-dependent Fis family transcriptional regulator [Myxococcales bacterium]
MSSVLIVDDEASVRFALSELLSERGHTVVTANSGAEALGKLEEADAVVTDLSMPGMSGLELLAKIASRDPSLPVVLLTAHGSERVAVEAMKHGAYDYLSKPFDIDELAHVIERALEARRLRQDNRRMSVERALGRRIVGEAPVMRRLLDTATRVASRDVTVLLRGETGTGKELIAELLHAHSSRAAGPLVRFNCAALPADLADAELFGHERGAFTGAHAKRTGYFGEADGGTLFLDEVGELPLPIQAKLLRALQEGEIQSVGSSRVTKVNVRVVAATNRDLAAMAKAGTFREDLYYRLAVVELTVPPLRDRTADIPELALEMTRRCAERFGLPRLSIEPALLEELRRADWPGNVRQLENTIARLAAMSAGGVLSLGDYREQRAPGAAPPVVADHDDADEHPAPSADLAAELPLRDQVEAFERGVIARVMEATGGNQSEAARRLGVSRVTLIDKLKKYGLARRS